MVCIFEGTLWFPFSPLYFQTKTKCLWDKELCSCVCTWEVTLSSMSRLHKVSSRPSSSSISSPSSNRNWVCSCCRFFFRQYVLPNTRPTATTPNTSTTISTTIAWCIRVSSSLSVPESLFKPAKKRRRRMRIWYPQWHNSTVKLERIESHTSSSVLAGVTHQLRVVSNHGREK